MFPFDGSWNPVYGKKIMVLKNHMKKTNTLRGAKFRDFDVTSGGMFVEHYALKSSLTLRRLMSYIYGAPILDVSRSHTTTQHSR